MQVKINIFAKPNAKKTAFLGVSEQGLLISIHAKPHQGAANQELIAYLAKLFHLPKTQIILQKGEGSRYKQVVMPLTDKVQKIIDQYWLIPPVVNTTGDHIVFATKNSCKFNNNPLSFIHDKT